MKEVQAFQTVQLIILLQLTVQTLIVTLNVTPHTLQSTQHLTRFKTATRFYLEIRTPLEIPFEFSDIIEIPANKTLDLNGNLTQESGNKLTIQNSTTDILKLFNNSHLNNFNDKVNGDILIACVDANTDSTCDGGDTQISQASLAVQSGHSVKLSAGTYHLSNFTIENYKLEGAGAANTTLTGNPVITLNNNGELHDVTIPSTSSNSLVVTTSGHSGQKIQDNVFKGFDQTFFLDNQGSTVLIDNNTFQHEGSEATNSYKAITSSGAQQLQIIQSNKKSHMVL